MHQHAEINVEELQEMKKKEALKIWRNSGQLYSIFNSFYS